MQKSTVHLVNELTDLLLQFPPMVTRFERKQPQALATLQDWLTASEQLLSSYSLVASAELAGLRSKLTAPVHRNEHRGQLRKQQLREAVEILYPLQHCLQQTLVPYQQKLQQSSELIRHLLSVISQSGALHYDAAAGFDSFLQQLWQLINQHDQLKAGAVQLRSWLSQQDITLLLAQEVNLADFS
ncbi:hypothetical protein WG68_03030 [Arsukibacterium ikkense]|uniref:Uncharacterized protein n=1 Tax=Arsukibacterium ikkense TaxID=336831 RepID=A0A0M2V7U6_9GAMM|nr:hypothetical protein [Arsukibacterium ikkense]KKO46927.1 hypothetical protein WG68_03030 [Arsukibacterium ikkense]